VLAQRAAEGCMRRAHPKQSIARYYEAFEAAREHSIDTTAERLASPLAGARAVARWAAVHTVTAALGLIRPPATLNRHGRKQPGWEALPNAEPLVAHANINESTVPPAKGAWSKASSLFG
jgi:hypothetical protein